MVNRNGLDINQRSKKKKNDEIKKRMINTCMNEERKVGKGLYLILGLIKQNGLTSRSVIFMLGLPKKKMIHVYS